MRFTKLKVTRQSAKRETSWLKKILSRSFFAGLTMRWKQWWNILFVVCFQVKLSLWAFCLRSRVEEAVPSIGGWSAIISLCFPSARTHPSVPPVCHALELDVELFGRAWIVERDRQLWDWIDPSHTRRSLGPANWQKRFFRPALDCRWEAVLVAQSSGSGDRLGFCHGQRSWYPF